MNKQDRDALDILDTLLDRLEAMSPEELERAREVASKVKFDPRAPVDKADLERQIAEWRQREANELFYRKLLLGRWPEPTEVEKQSALAAVEYDRACDQYDALICGPGGVPRTSEQHKLVYHHAAETRRLVMDKYGITNKQLQEAFRVRR